MIPTRRQLFLSFLLLCSLFLRHRIYGKREAAVVHERSVRPRIELPEEDELFVHSQLQSFREQVQERVSDHGVEGIGDHTVFASSVGGNLKTTSKDDSHLRRVTDDQGVEVTFDVSWKNLDKFQAKPNSSRDLIASTIRQSTEVTKRQLDRDGRKEFEVAKSAEIQSWLRYEAVTALLRSQYQHRDTMKMRWVLRYKESGKPKARLVIIGHHDPRVGSDVRTEALVASRRGRSQFFMATAHNQFSIENRDVKNAFRLMCFHINDIMISGPKDNPEVKRMMDKVKRLYEWDEWEQHEFDQCGCRTRQATDKSVTVDQESYVRKISLVTMSAHRRKHMSETLSAEEHTTLMAKCGELNWLATQSMIQLLAALSLIDTSKTATGQSLKDVNRLVRQALCEASDKVH